MLTTGIDSEVEFSAAVAQLVSAWPEAPAGATQKVAVDAAAAPWAGISAAAAASGPAAAASTRNLTLGNRNMDVLLTRMAPDDPAHLLDARAVPLVYVLRDYNGGCRKRLEHVGFPHG